MTEKFDTVSDSVLVLEISKNNKDAFKMLYNRYSKKIYYFSLKYFGVKEESEELLQSIFINIWEHRKSFDADTQIKSYIYKSALNYITNFLKRKSICARFIESEISRADAISENTYQEIILHDLESSLASMMERLPEQQKKIFQLNRMHGLSNKEIACKLDISVRTVENQMYRALKMMKTLLKERYILFLLLIWILLLS